MMTRKDYVKFAKVLKDAQRFLAFLRQSDYQGTLAAKQMLRDIEKDLVNIFKEDNPSFDADRFIAAADAERETS